MLLDDVLLLELLVDEVDAEPLSGPLHPGDEVAEVADGLHLLLEVLRLDEVHQLRVLRVVRDLVQLQQGLQRECEES